VVVSAPIWRRSRRFAGMGGQLPCSLVMPSAWGGCAAGPETRTNRRRCTRGSDRTLCGLAAMEALSAEGAQPVTRRGAAQAEHPGVARVDR
jgi:hypothetical protein